MDEHEESESTMRMHDARPALDSKDEHDATVATVYAGARLAQCDAHCVASRRCAESGWLDEIRISRGESVFVIVVETEPGESTWVSVRTNSGRLSWEGASGDATPKQCAEALIKDFLELRP